MTILYRPEENSVGVIYSRWGRFRRFVSPDQWVLLFPLFHRVQQEVRMNMRTAHIFLGDIATRDGVTMNVELKIFYSIDLRVIDPMRRIQVLHFENERAFEEIVKTTITDISRNRVFIARNYSDMTTQMGRAEVKGSLSSLLTECVRSFGILTDPRFAVNIVDMQPNSDYQKAVQERAAADALGTAAARRVRPLLDQLGDGDQAQAVRLLLMEIAAAVAKTGQTPDVYISNDSSLAGVSPRNVHQIRTPADFTQPKRRPPSTAAD